MRIFTGKTTRVTIKFVVGGIKSWVWKCSGYQNVATEYKAIDDIKDGDDESIVKNFSI